MNNKKILAVTVLILLAAPAIAKPLYAPYEDWPPCAVMEAVGENALDGRVVTGVICRSTAFIPDSDSDGVPDNTDQCPETPEGAKVNSEGCPIDSDSAGVPDYQDQCLGTPSDKEVNAMGCSKPLALHSVHFGFDSATLTPKSRKILNKVAESLRYYPELEITVAGYTDSTGSMAYNQRLSQQRAEVVMNYLLSRGADPSMLKAVGYGEKHPVASNDTREGRARNRRVEFLMPQDPIDH